MFIDEWTHCTYCCDNCTKHNDRICRRRAASIRFLTLTFRCCLILSWLADNSFSDTAMSSLFPRADTSGGSFSSTSSTSSRTLIDKTSLSSRFVSLINSNQTRQVRHAFNRDRVDRWLNICVNSVLSFHSSSSKNGRPRCKRRKQSLYLVLRYFFTGKSTSIWSP